MPPMLSPASFRHGRRPKVLGVNLSHNGSATLVLDGAPRVAVSEERLVRRKNCRGFAESADYCLKAAGLAVADIDVLALCDLLSTDAAFRASQRAVTIQGRRFAAGQDLVCVNHHMAHAMSAFLCSGFERALVMTIDGIGAGESSLVSESFYEADERGVRLVDANPKPQGSPYLSVGHTFESFTNHLGFHDAAFEAGKTMALAAYGDAIRFDLPLSRLVGGHIATNPLVIRPDDFSERGRAVGNHSRNLNRELFGAPLQSWEEQTQFHRDLAAWLQAESERICLSKVRDVLRRHPHSRLCIAGGVGLNGLINERILREAGIDELFVQPAASDDGTSLGAALYADWLATEEPAGYTMRDAFLGRSYDRAEIEAAVRGTPGLLASARPDWCSRAARALAAGRVVGLFSGRSEFGPRALGARSILAHPALPGMRDHLNLDVKGREPFRPFAPAMPLADAGEYCATSTPSPFMLRVVSVREDRVQRIPEATHVDGSARLQTVTPETNPALHALLRAFEKEAGMPVLLNTSLNARGQPIVESPRDAVECFLETGLDLLVLEDSLVVSEANAGLLEADAVEADAS